MVSGCTGAHSKHAVRGSAEARHTAGSAPTSVVSGYKRSDQAMNGSQIFENFSRLLLLSSRVNTSILQENIPAYLALSPEEQVETRTDCMLEHAREAKQKQYI